MIYSIPCGGTGEDECPYSYVGQTKQQLGKRLDNHRRDLKKSHDPSVPKTALMDHFQNDGHYPNFSKVTILDTQHKYNKRLTLEALHIYTNHTINKKRDTDDISAVYCALVDNNTTNYKKRKRTENSIDHQHITHNDTHTHNNTPIAKRRRIN